MSPSFSFTKSFKGTADTAVILVDDKKKLSAQAKALDKKAGGIIQETLKSAAGFKAQSGDTLSITLPGKSGFNRAVCLSVGKTSDLNEVGAKDTGGKLFAALKSAGAEKCVIFADTLTGLKNIEPGAVYGLIAAGLELRAYNFDKYKSKKDKDKAKPLTKVTITGDVQAKASSTFKALSKVNQGVFLARTLVNEPPNALYPEAYAKIIADELKPLGVTVEVLDEKKMARLGMGAILAVGMGSARKPRMVIMRWNGGPGSKKGGRPLALVGKGVTFDTGGISLKPGAGMDEMKMDMGGSAAVVGTIKALALRKAKVNVVGIVGLAENMPSHDAYRPGDIITSYAGKTIEVLNTDAEGRLVLADCLTYVQNTYKPQLIIDLATLTGAMMVALGHEYCGTFANNDKLWSQLEQASAATGEKLWRMPLDPVWKKEMESEVADIQNMGQTSRFAGACTAAGFLEHFIEDDTPWAHMDIAGTAWLKKDRPTVPKFGTGFGVYVLDRMITDHYES